MEREGMEGEGMEGESESLILCQGLDSLQLLDCTTALTGGGGERQRVFMWAGETERESTVKFNGGQNSSFDATLDRPGHSSSRWGQRGKLELRLPGPGEKVKHNKHTSLPLASLWYGSDFFRQLSLQGDLQHTNGPHLGWRLYYLCHQRLLYQPDALTGAALSHRWVSFSLTCSPFLPFTSLILEFLQFSQAPCYHCWAVNSGETTYLRRQK